MTSSYTYISVAVVQQLLKHITAAVIQWNLSIVDTLGTWYIVLYRVVSSIQG